MRLCRKSFRNFLIFSNLLLALSHEMKSQVKVNTSMPLREMIERLVGPGVKVSNIRVNCPSDKGLPYAYFEDNTGTIGIEDGLLMTTGAAQNAIGPNNSGAVSQSNGNNSQDPDLAVLLAEGEKQFDACSIEFDVQVFADTLSFEYVFGSEEYLEFIRDYHDVFGFFISGPGLPGSVNMALVPGTDLPVSVLNVNNNTNSQWFTFNGNGDTPFDNLFLQYDGITKRLTSRVPVVPCATYSLKLAICDVKDDAYDAGIFIAGRSLQTRAPILAYSFEHKKFPHAIEGCNGVFVSVKRQVRTEEPATYLLTYSGSASRNVDYGQVPDTLVFKAGEIVKSFFVTVYKDSIVEAPEEIRIGLINPCPGLPEVAGISVPIEESFDFALDDRLICLGKSLVLNPNPQGTFSYKWAPPNGLSCTDCASPECFISRDVQYECTITDPASTCQAKDKLYVKVVPGPFAAFSLDSIAGLSSLDIAFKNESEYSDSWLWDFGDASGSNEFSPEHYYGSGFNRDSVSYQVSLIVWNSVAGCSDTLVKELKISNPLFIPNLITPNGDGANDVFFIRGISPGTWQLEVFDRWGKRVFESRAYQLDWNPGLVSKGLYFYRLSEKRSGKEFNGWLRSE